MVLNVGTRFSCLLTLFKADFTPSPFLKNPTPTAVKPCVDSGYFCHWPTIPFALFPIPLFCAIALPFWISAKWRSSAHLFIVYHCVQNRVEWFRTFCVDQKRALCCRSGIFLSNPKKSARARGNIFIIKKLQGPYNKIFFRTVAKTFILLQRTNAKQIGNSV